MSRMVQWNHQVFFGEIDVEVFMGAQAVKEGHDWIMALKKTSCMRIAYG